MKIKLQKQATKSSEMKKILSAIALILLFCGCEKTYTSEVESNPNHKNDITYFKDQRTGACFAGILSKTSHGYNVMSITCVPCEFYEKYISK